MFLGATHWVGVLMDGSPEILERAVNLLKMTTHYVIGVDGGTESLRAGVFDLTGKPVAMASSSYATSYPQPSWAEQNPADWWKVRSVKFLLIRRPYGVSIRRCLLCPT